MVREASPAPNAIVETQLATFSNLGKGSRDDRPASREAAQECSPRRKPWVHAVNEEAPEGEKDKLL